MNLKLVLAFFHSDLERTSQIKYMSTAGCTSIVGYEGVFQNSVDT